MSNENQILIIDAGNTSIKLALFKDGELIQVERIQKQNLSEIAALKKQQVVISSVLSKEETKKIASLFNQPLVVTYKTPLPITLQYESIETLGIDRICNAVYASRKINKGYAVTVDIGTCVKFDLVNSDGKYLGGSISPGIELRYKSLNDYTGNLPLLSDKNKTPLVGVNTESSIRSGVINGINAEIHRLMEQYALQFDDLTFFMTGGDIRYFDIHSKNDIFAIENLTLLGLYEIYLFNA